MKLLHLKYAFILCICSMLLSCAKKEPADILVKKKGTWNYLYKDTYHPDSESFSSSTGQIIFNTNGTGVQKTDTADIAIKWAATNFTVRIEHSPQFYTYYAIKEESTKKVVLENISYLAHFGTKYYRILILTKD